MNIQFFGAAQTVTGSKHMLTTDSGKKILLDCGMFQGMGPRGDELNRDFGFNAAEVDCLILSHAHIDHSGLLPKLVKEGFKGEIYCTSPTYDLCVIMLRDSAHIQESDLIFINKRRKKRGEEPLVPLYTIEDAEAVIDKMVEVPYHETTKINDEVSLAYTDQGHILGSTAVNLTLLSGGKTIKLTFSGDIGRPHDRILRGPEPFPQADYIICESTYGDRLHESSVGAEEKLLRIVNETCVTNKGKLIIPAFSIDRTQELLYALDRMEHDGKLPPIKVYVDSPLSVNATNIMRKHRECYNQELIDYLKTDRENDAFGFKNLVYITDVNESKKLNDSHEPCIIISASGMAEAGRIKHHIKNNVENAKNTILIVGYCSPPSLGGALKRGDKEVRIFGEMYKVKARIEIIDSYSAHGDYNEMIGWLKCQDPKKVKTLFLVHGEKDVQDAFKEKLIKEGFSHIEIPAMKDSFELV